MTDFLKKTGVASFSDFFGFMSTLAEAAPRSPLRALAPTDGNCAPVCVGDSNFGDIVARLAAQLRGPLCVPREIVEFFLFSLADPAASLHQELTNALCLHGERRKDAAAAAHRLIRSAVAHSAPPHVVEVQCHKQPGAFRGDEEYMHELLAFC